MWKFLKAVLLAAFLFAFTFGGVSSQSALIIPIEFGEPVMIGTQAGPNLFTPKAIVIHHSGSWPYGSYTDADMIAGYRRYHMETVHPGVYPEWLGKMPAQEGYPDGLSAPRGYDYNDTDYHGFIGTDGNFYPGRKMDTVGWHAGGALKGMPEINTYALGLCFVGNFTDRPPSEMQLNAGVQKAAEWMLEYDIPFWAIYPHWYIRWSSEGYYATECPGYYFPWDDFYFSVRMQVAGFYDLSRTYWAYNDIRELTSSGFVQGYGDETLKPENPITRAEFISVLWKMNGSPIPHTYGSFVDVWGHWAEKAISWAIETGLVKGYDNGFFYPDQSITRAEIAAVIFRYLQPFPSWENYFSDIQGHWAQDFINTCHREGLLNGYPDGTFRPNNATTRAEAFAILARMK